jgi:hypothetical protein
MRAGVFDKAVEEVVGLKLRAVDRLTKELIEPLADVGNPEKVLRKPYEQWGENDLALAAKIYGPGDNTPLANLIFRKALERVKSLEEEEI